MSMEQPEAMTMDEFRVIVRRAGLNLEQEELDHLLPLYRQLLVQLDALHDPSLPLELPADTFVPDWN